MIFTLNIIILSNIIINGSFEDSPKIDIHKQHTSIANLVLNDFNKRLNLDISVTYNSAIFDFSVDSDELNTKEICYRIQNFTDWGLQVDAEKKLRTDVFINFVSNTYFEPAYSSITFPRSLNKLDENDIDYFILLRNKFLIIFKDYVHLPFISESCNLKIKKELNRMCFDLEQLVKSK